MTKFLSFLIVLVLGISQVYAGSIAGQVTAKKSGEPLMGANVYLKGTTIGAAAEEDGMYLIDVEDGEYTLVCDYVGYARQEVEIEVSGDMKQDFVMVEYLFSSTIEVIADRARERETPVAFTNVGKMEIVNALGSQDIPMVLNTTPSVYATMQGGGAGDARINVRGFNQRNVAIMINGVPVNDMENGWVYWSNWDGVGDASQSLQIQRGLSAVNLATPSIGGTMNIITDPTASEMGFMLKQEVGSGSFLKTTFTAASGLIDGKFAANATIVRKVGEGVVDGTWTDAWAYYVGLAYNINDDNRIELYGVGAPQRHGQNYYKQNIGAYSHEYAKDLDDYDPAALQVYKEARNGRLYNQTWNKMTINYKGKQAVGDDTFERYDDGFLNEKENFYHKPQVNLNWYSNFAENIGLTTILYYSGGIGGGTGYAGSWVWDSDSEPTRIPDWDATIERNQTNATGSTGILRNSRNNQNTIGLISKLNWKPMSNLSTAIGIDWRKAEIEHYYEVRDLLGGDYYIPASYYRSEFWGTNEVRLGLGDKFNYFNTNKVDWIGGFVQAEYTMEDWTAYTTFGVSSVAYSYTNHFKTADTLANGNPDLSSGEFKLDSDPEYGFQIKGGAMYRLSDIGDVYANIGYVEKVPIFDNVIDDNNGVFSENPETEKFTSFEIGTDWLLFENQVTLKANIYYTLWQDRALPQSIQVDDDTWDIIFLTGMDQLHRGLEFEAAYQPMPLFRFDLAGSISIWEHVSDAKGQYRAVESGSLATTTYLVGIDGLKVGDAPQTQIALAGTIFPIIGARAQLAFRYYDDFYAAWDPTSRIVFDGATPDRAQSWKVPAYGLLDFHGSYNLPFDVKGVKLTISAHVFNILDELYISDATDNSDYSSYKIDHDDNPATDKIIVNPHKADAAEVYMGLPRTFNIGLTLHY
ncbi:MAG: TonB-dependent receptor [Calditrichaceae bacterium]|nr:TonB-dependent receptor [Calditrichaceae bacterium]MBN2708493.1 TonB-dependent receptor [Calditrichaceae bacterium]RQV91963.1 MAG: TonB-dependent receptor [Calditrichota bacterium]